LGPLPSLLWLLELLLFNQMLLLLLARAFSIAIAMLLCQAFFNL
jgi:hypothetical protein